MRALVNKPFSVRIRVEDDAGVPFTADSLTVSVKDRDGTEIASGAGMEVVGDPGKYTFRFTPTALGHLTVSWDAVEGAETTSGVEDVNVVDRRTVPLSVLLADPSISDRTLYPLWDVLDAADGAEDALGDALGMRLVQEVDRVTFRVPEPQRALRVRTAYLQEVLSASRDGTVIDPTLIEIDEGFLILPTYGSWSFLTGGLVTGSWQAGRYTFDVRRGLLSSPADIQNAVRILTRHYAQSGAPDGHPDRASKIISADTEIWMARMTPGAWFGIPEVDSVVSARREELPIADKVLF